MESQTPNKFDLKVHHRTRKGHLIKVDPYNLYIDKGTHYYERPILSGNLFFENNAPAGRIERDFDKNGNIISEKFDFTAAHKEYVPPVTGAEKLAAENADLQAKYAQAQAELAAIKAELEAKAGAKEKTVAQSNDSISEAPGLASMTKGARK